jgi:transcriptional regulator with XRE-family HTH domain
LSQILKILGKNLRYFRNKKELTQLQLSERIGCHRSYISRIENAKINIYVHTLVEIAKALGVRPKDLVK